MGDVINSKLSLVKTTQINALKNIFKTLMVLMLFMHSSGVIASSCNQISPQFKKLQDAYFEINSIDLSKDNIETIEGFYKEITGRWKGEYSVFECKGNEKDPREIVNNGRVRSDIQQDSKGVLIIDDDIDFKKDRPSMSRKINTQRWEHIITVDLNTKRKYSFIEKYRNRSATGAAILVENVYTFDRTEYKKLEILKTTYNGGYFSKEERWNLKK